MQRSPYSTTDIFTPAKPARETFVERHKVNNILVNALRTPGKQIIVYGHSGCGKTTLLINKLEQTYEKHIVTRCMSHMTIDSIIMHAFSELDRFYIESYSKKQGTKFTIGGEYSSIKAALEATKEQGMTLKPILPPLLTAQFLAKFCGEVNCCWVLEDFHKIAVENKKSASQIMKVFVDTAADYANAKVIAIGAVDSGKEVVAYDDEMRLRISEVSVPLMTEEELEEIISLGEDRLNIFFESGVKIAIVKISSGLASICHDLCLHCCWEANVHQTQKTKVAIRNDIFESALASYIETRSSTLKSEYDLVTKNDGLTPSLPVEILKILSASRREEVRLQYVIDGLQRAFPSKFEPHLIKKILDEFVGEERGAILIFNQMRNSYTFVNLAIKVYIQCLERDTGMRIAKRKEALEKALLMKFLNLVNNGGSKSDYSHGLEDDDFSGDLMDDILDEEED